MLESMREPAGIHREELARAWHEEMIWWGPGGIGATYTIERYVRQHGSPFREAGYAQRTFNGHLCQMAEGKFGGFFGWANLTLLNSGGYMGMTASPKLADMSVVDIYRAEGGKLAENWVFIDMLHWLDMQGLDVLARNRALGATGEDDQDADGLSAWLLKAAWAISGHPPLQASGLADDQLAPEQADLRREVGVGNAGRKAPGRRARHPMQGLAHGRELISRQAREARAVDAHDRKVPGDADLQLPRAIQGADGHGVVLRDDGRG